MSTRSQSQIGYGEHFSFPDFAASRPRGKLGIVSIIVSLPEDPDLSEMAESVNEDPSGFASSSSPPLEAARSIPAALAEAISVARVSVSAARAQGNQDRRSRLGNRLQHVDFAF
jgi:hypothetical protein